jgi:hypothetical protein
MLLFHLGSEIVHTLHKHAIMWKKIIKIRKVKFWKVKIIPWLHRSMSRIIKWSPVTSSQPVLEHLVFSLISKVNA